MQVSENQFTPHPSVVYTKLDDSQAVLLHLETKRYYSLNETGLFIWELLQNGTTNPDDMSTALQGEYEVEEGESLAYVLEFLGELHQEGLLEK